MVKGGEFSPWGGVLKISGNVDLQKFPAGSSFLLLAGQLTYECTGAMGGKYPKDKGPTVCCVLTFSSHSCL